MNKVYIAGNRTNINWFRDKTSVDIGGDPEPWKEIFKNYFVERLRTRYLEPIRRIQTGDLKGGEGFSIVAIQCSLIEFLETTRRGWNFEYGYPFPPKEDDSEDSYKYGTKGSSILFTDFLTKREPFASFFPNDKVLAKDFYTNVRCPILHEARTSGGWIIHADSGFSSIIDITKTSEKILYRNDMTAALWQYITAYGDELCTEKDLQEAFIRKFDALATP